MNHKVSHVTVFLQGAQILREAQVDLSKGNYILHFSGLSPFLHESSIQVTSGGNFTLLNTYFHLTYRKVKLNSFDIPKIQKNIHDTQLAMDSLASEIKLFQGKSDRLQHRPALQDLEVSDYINLNSYELEYYEKTHRYIAAMARMQDRMQDSINVWNIKINQSQKEKIIPKGELFVEVELSQNEHSKIAIAYFTNAAGWYPRYDIRASEVNRPLEIVYKAIVNQQSLENWENTALTISSAEPLHFKSLPQLQTWYVPGPRPVYANNSKKTPSSTIRGYVHDATGSPLIGATIRVEGTSIGTVADIDGSFEITVPGDVSELLISYMGYNPKVEKIVSDYLDIEMEEDYTILEEVVVMGYAGGADYSPRTSYQENLDRIRNSVKKQEIVRPQTNKREYSTSFSFDVDHHYTIKSMGVSQEVELIKYQIPAKYHYYIVPKANLQAYLIASIVDWGQYNLLEGEATVYFQKTYIGKTLLDVRYVTDSLVISLGQDHSILVERNNYKPFTDKKWLGSEVEITQGWQFLIRNQKNIAVQCVIMDQYPIAQKDNWQVKIKRDDHAQRDEATGTLKWLVNLPPNKTWEAIFQYEIKCPAQDASRLD